MSGETLTKLALRADLASHRFFLNRYYGVSRSFYDATRKYFLFGRDAALRDLLSEPWSSLVEVGPGTGRNLRLLQKARPEAAYGGIEPCDALRKHLRGQAPWVRTVDAFAEDADYAAVLGRPPERILFSYCLSMVGDPGGCLQRAVAALPPEGEVRVVDFGPMEGVPRALRMPFRRFLEAFHVEPLDFSRLGVRPEAVERGPLGYWVSGLFRAAERP